ncbi:MAG: hypothetical protein WD638_04055 [Nitriliruptoraceae bacterium]
MLTIQKYRSMRYQDIYRLLTRELPVEAMLDLGVAVRTTNEHGQFVAKLSCTVHHVYNYTRRLRDRVDGDGPITDEVRSLLLDVLHRIIDVGLPTRPEGAAAYAIDESGTWAYSRRRQTTPDGGFTVDPVDAMAEHADEVVDETDIAPPARLTASVDPDAANGNKTAKNGREEPYFGYGIHGLVRAPKLGTDGSSEPLLVERIDLVPASTDVADPSLRMIDSLLAKPGGRITELLGDRHYSYKEMNRWFRQLHLQGIRQVHDLRADEQGFYDVDGMRVVGSSPHCPGTPDHLASIPRPQPPAERAGPRTRITGGTDAQRRQVSAIDTHKHDAYVQRREIFKARIAERQAYAMQRVTGVDVDKIRQCCRHSTEPSAARSAKARCRPHGPTDSRPWTTHPRRPPHRRAARSRP